MTDYIRGLNEEQTRAVTTTEGFVRVVAGAGSGKTKALTSRYAYIVDALGISTANVLCITFTNKAASEMRSRIRAMLGDMDLAMICTFHGFCNQLLRADSAKINYPKNYVILDTEDSKDLLKTIYRERNITSSQITVKQALNMIARRKREDGEYASMMAATSDEALRNRYLAAEAERDVAYYGYLYYTKKSNGLDFDDLLLLAVHVLEQHADVREKWQQRLEYIMVDEYQDVSYNQYKLCKILSAKHGNLFAVGDPDQTIYRFRGADVKYFLEFEREFVPTQTIVMDKNYRSSPEILAASNSLIEKNTMRIDKALRPTRTRGAAVVYNHCNTEADEAKWLAETAKAAIEQGTSPKDIAVLYRAHYVTRNIEEALITAQVPYTIYSGIEFYARKEVKDVLAYLRMLVSADDISFLRTVNEPRRSIGKKKLAFLCEQADAMHCTLFEALRANVSAPQMKGSGARAYIELIDRYRELADELCPSELAKAIMVDSGYERALRTLGDDERLENLEELVASMLQMEAAEGEDVLLGDYLDRAALFTNVDKTEKVPSVSLMTMHAAKGLEFPIVFLCCMNEGVIPSRNTRTPDDLEEERRLAYVGMTRAENLLFISDSEGINHDGSYKYPSRFIFNIDKELLHYTVELREDLIKAAAGFSTPPALAPDPALASTFTKGDEVTHRVFGAGVVEQVTNDGITVRFQENDLVRTFDRRAKALSPASSTPPAGAAAPAPAPHGDPISSDVVANILEGSGISIAQSTPTRPSSARRRSGSAALQARWRD